MTNPLPNKPFSAKSEVEWLEIGKIVAPQGIKGELRVVPDSDFPERFLEPGTRWWRRSPDSTPQPIQLLQGRYHPGKSLYIVQLEGVSDREQAEAWRGCRLLVPASERPQLEAGEYHVMDLIGVSVYHQQTQAYIGQVVDTMVAGNDLLVIQPATEANNTESGSKKKRSQRQLLIPFVEAIVPFVDLESDRIEILPPEGLLDL
ncbi:ribosome maturation factor RimM [Geitlerinema sp. PCC 9228]|jgi:16S rRNA processing protein RimM|uniref:ribosome maturation factor RimM n=1 Tax=Geitlerinema sp. PCC 9228 TaxID=111611 RepID=UPI0008F9BB24|nr:ribosome maturation factor RimM [Geitlerinema sp. PCC 9228]